MLGRAASRFSGHGFVQFSTLDIEGDVIDQGLNLGNFDLIVAANVLRPVSSLRTVLQRIRSLLAPDGQLMLIEKHAERWYDLVFGQLTQSDPHVCPQSTLLSAREWTAVLQANGFAQSVVLSDASACESKYR